MVINGASSQPVHVLSGVPQGSVLGQLLFIFYINTLTNLKLSGGSKLVMYADDLVLHKAIITEEEWILSRMTLTVSCSGWMKIC